MKSAGDLFANVSILLFSLIVLYAVLRGIDEWLRDRKEQRNRNAQDIIF